MKSELSIYLFRVIKNSALNWLSSKIICGIRNKIILHKCFISLLLLVLFVLMINIKSNKMMVSILAIDLLNIFEMTEEKIQRDLSLVSSPNNITNYGDDIASTLLNPPHTLLPEDESNTGGVALFIYGSNLNPPHTLAFANESHGDGEALYELLNTSQHILPTENESYVYGVALFKYSLNLLVAQNHLQLQSSAGKCNFKQTFNLLHHQTRRLLNIIYTLSLVSLVYLANNEAHLLIFKVIYLLSCVTIGLLSYTHHYTLRAVLQPLIKMQREISLFCSSNNNTNYGNDTVFTLLNPSPPHTLSNENESYSVGVALSCMYISCSFIHINCI